MSVVAANFGYLKQWGTKGSANGQFDAPFGVAADGAGNIYVTEGINSRVQKFTGDGNYITQWGGKGTGNGQFNQPFNVAADGAGNIYVTDGVNLNVQKFNSNGNYITQWGGKGTGNGQFNQPIGVAADGAGNIYVTDGVNLNVQKFNSNGNYITQWGGKGTGNGQFNQPIGVAADGAGNIYITDGINSCIQKFTGDGNYITQWGTQGSGNSQFSKPFSVAADGAGNIYVTDTNYHRVQKFGPFLNLTLVPVSAVNYINTKVAVMISTPIAANLGNFINPNEDFNFSISIKNAASDGGVPLKNIVWHIWVDNNTIAQLYVPPLNVVRNGLSSTSAILSSGTLVKEIFIFPTEISPQIEPRNHLGVGDSSMIRLSGKAGTNPIGGNTVINFRIYADIDPDFLLPKAVNAPTTTVELGITG